MPDGRFVQPVALLQPAGNVCDAVAAAGAEIVGQQAGRGDPIHVIVAENRDFFPARKREPDALRRPVHLLHEKGAADFPIALNRFFGTRRRVIATGAERPRGQRRKAGRAKLCHILLADGGNVPNIILQKNPHPLCFLISRRAAALRGRRRVPSSRPKADGGNAVLRQSISPQDAAALSAERTGCFGKGPWIPASEAILLTAGIGDYRACGLIQFTLL